MLLIFNFSRFTSKHPRSYFFQSITNLTHCSDENYNQENLSFHLQRTRISLIFASTFPDTTPEDALSPRQRG